MSPHYKRPAPGSRQAVFAAACILLSGAAGFGQSAAASLAGSATARLKTATLQEARQDPLIAAMLDELDRSKAELQLQGFQRPYFIEYRLEDLATFNASATFGSIDLDDESHRRIVRVTVRVGDYKTDNSTGNARADGSVQIAAVEDDPAALRYSLWAATDVAYKNAIRGLTQKQTELKSIQSPPQADDFSHEQPLIVLEPVTKLDLDETAWKQRIAEASGLYREASDKAAGDDAAIEQSSAEISAEAANRYLVNTEGTIVRTPVSIYRASLKVAGQAPDGKPINRTYNSNGTAASELASAEEFRTKSLETLKLLRELEQAPLVENEYHGPVLLEAHAAASRFLEVFSSGIAASRPPLGNEQRTTGAFASSYKSRVLPETFNVVDDPTLKSYDGKPLLGAYDVDDEGVPAQAVKVVEQGKLTNYLIGRQPVRDFPASNGHGRAGIGSGAVPHFGVLRVEATDGIPPKDLEAKLLSMAKDSGLSTVYIAAGGNRIYRVNVADGKRELVRGAELADVDLRALRSGIVAAGNDAYVLNVAEGIPSTIIAPSLLFDDAVVKRANQKNDKLPYYPPPD